MKITRFFGTRTLRIGQRLDIGTLVSWINSRACVSLDTAMGYGQPLKGLYTKTPGIETATSLIGFQSRKNGRVKWWLTSAIPIHFAASGTPLMAMAAPTS